MTKESTGIRKLVSAALCLAIAMVLPFLTGQIPEVGQALCPMHIPVLLCGFVCGWPWGLAVGFLSPLLRYLLFGMPPIYPVGVAMAFELAAYGLFTGILYRHLPQKVSSIYLTLILSMILGRVVWGIVQFVLAGLTGGTFPFSAFLAGAVTTAIPGIVVHILLIPLLVMALRKAKLIL